MDRGDRYTGRNNGHAVAISRISFDAGGMATVPGADDLHRVRSSAIAALRRGIKGNNARDSTAFSFFWQLLRHLTKLLF